MISLQRYHYCNYTKAMPKPDKLLSALRRNPKGVGFDDLERLCRHYFGDPRQAGSHLVFRTPWPGDPRINIQRDKNGMAKPYQVRQVLAAIEKLESMKHG